WIFICEGVNPNSQPIFREWPILIPLRPPSSTLPAAAAVSSVSGSPISLTKKLPFFNQFVLLAASAAAAGMLFFHLNMSAAHLPANPALMGIAVDHGVVECMFSTRLAPPNYHIPYVRSLCAMCGSLSSSRRILTIGVASASSDAQPTFDFDKYFLSELGICSTDEQFTYENKGECEAELSEVRSMFHDAENAEKKQRRRDLKHGNKGRVPWNKGRKHSAETRELIKRRTIEALRSPQVKSC
ncbi:hypothetical protein LINPERHAP2_LOCUS14915, partial [Linum perenne]